MVICLAFSDSLIIALPRHARIVKLEHAFAEHTSVPRGSILQLVQDLQIYKRIRPPRPAELRVGSDVGLSSN